MATEHFTDKELACPHCGEMYDDPLSLAVLEELRAFVGPLKINSAHRCAFYNAKVGGAPLSMHKKLAFDIAIGKYERGLLLVKARMSGFRGFGYGQTFLHVDARLYPAQWFYGPISEKLWRGQLG